MNNISKLLLGVAALGLWSCSNDEPATGGNENGIAKGDVAYLNVRITGEGVSSRANDFYTDADGNQIKYEYGTESESKVKDAWFYFFDAAGKYQLKSNGFTKKGEKPNENVEVYGDNTVILEGLTGKNYPKWVVTILNKPGEFTEPTVGLTSLQDFHDMVLSAYRNGMPNANGVVTDGDFTMTTSSFINETQQDDDVNASINDGQNPWYFATRLNDKNFLTQSPEDKYEPADENTRVVIYVERLAARVEVAVSSTIANQKVAYGDHFIYKLDNTVGGSDNDTEDGVAKTDIYVELLGWELSATANRTKLVKDLGDWTAATNFGTDWAWNHSAYHRSYWGKAWTYGKTGDELTSMLSINQHYETLSQKIDEGTATKGTVAYCRENTNEVDNIVVDGTVSPRRATTVLVKARLCDVNGTSLSVVTFNGVPYYKDDFIKNVMNLAGMQNYYTRDEGTEFELSDGSTKTLYNYTRITPEQVEMVLTGAGTGKVKVQTIDGLQFYTLTGVDETFTDKDGNTHTIHGANGVQKSSLDSALAAITTGASNEAVAATDGAVFYPIVIEHLNNPTGDDAVEAQWGVVRNHAYKVTITKISGLGKGVFDPDHVGDDWGEILDPEDPKDPTYYVESYINILSWKIVAQEAEI